MFCANCIEMMSKTFSGILSLLYENLFIKFFQIYSQTNSSNPMILQKTLCGQTIPITFAVKGCRVDLNFSSNSINTFQGYNITYRVKVPATQGKRLLQKVVELAPSIELGYREGINIFVHSEHHICHSELLRQHLN